MNIAEISEAKIYDINEGFIEALKRSEAEWSRIKKDAETSRRYWLTASVGLPLVQHEVSIISLIGFAFWFRNSLKEEENKLDFFRNTNPLSVYVDLKHKDDGFFSILKNCIF